MSESTQVVKLRKGALEQIFYVELRDDGGADDGALLGALAFGGLTADKIEWNVDAAVVALTPEDIAALGTYAPPTSNAHIRFKETAGLAGLYEVQVHDDWVDAEARITLILQGANTMPKRIDIVVEDTAREDTVQAISTTGVTINSTAASRVLTGGTTEVGVYGNTEHVDGVYHEINDNAGTTDMHYVFDIGSEGVPTGVRWTGYMFSNNDDMDVYAMNWGTGWELIGNIDGKNLSVNEVHEFTLFPKHVGTGVDLGAVHIRFEQAGLSASELQTDQLIVQYAVINRSAGYAGGAIWVDTNSGIAGSVPFINGTADNPVLTWGDALLLATALTMKKFHIINGSTIQLSAPSNNFTLEGDNWILDLNTQAIAGAHFSGASSVTGVGTGAGYDFHTCNFGAANLADGHFNFCGFMGTLTLTAAGTYTLDSCHSMVAGTTAPLFDFGGVGNTNFNMRHYSGGAQIENMETAGTDTMSLEGHGQLILAASCAGGTIAIRGHFTITDNVAGGFVAGAGGVISDDARFTRSEVSDAVWDEDIVAAHGTAATAGLLLRALGSGISLRANNATLEDLLGVADTAATDTVAGQVWQETLAGHNVAGSMGEAMNDLVAAGFPTVATIADGVWDEDIVAAHGTGDTAGLLLRALGAEISQRTNNLTLNDLLGVADIAGYTIADTVVRKDISAITTADTVSNLILTLGKVIQDRANNNNLDALLGVADTASFDIAYTIWDELTSLHTTAHSAGQRLQALDVLLEASGAGDAAEIFLQCQKIDKAALLDVGDPGYDADSIAGDLDSISATLATIDRDIVTAVNIEGSDIRITAGVEQYGLLQTAPWTQCSAQIFNEAGAIIHNIAIGDFGAIGARGFFSFTQVSHVLVSGQTYEIEVTITDGALEIYQNTKLFKVVNV